VLWKTVIATAVLVLGAATAQAMTAMLIHQQDGMIAKVAYGCGPDQTRFGGVCLARIPIRLWPDYYGPDYYDYVPPDSYGVMDNTTPVCHRSEEIVRVPSERGGTRQIKVIRCP
jgi:hypothetical protein